MFEAMKGRNNPEYNAVFITRFKRCSMLCNYTPCVSNGLGTFITRVIFFGHNMDAARQQLTASAPRQFLPKPVLQALYPPCDTWFEFVRGLPYGQWSIEQIEVSHPHQSRSGRDHLQGLTEPYIYYYNDFWCFVNTFWKLFFHLFDCPFHLACYALGNTTHIAF